MGIKADQAGKVVGNPPVRILEGISLDIPAGEFVSLTGRSGSGKSTLLYLLSSLDPASEGSITVDDVDLSRLSQEELAKFRNERMGFVFQFHYLLAELSALENVLMPARKSSRERELGKYAQELLAQFRLGDKMHRLPRQLSGGEQQRVAIARALVMSPQYLFADEPTGALDTASGELVMQIIADVNRRLGTTVVLVTHEPGFAARAQRKIHLVDGRIVS